MRKGPLIVVTGALGVLAAAIAVRKLLENPDVRARLGEFRDTLATSVRELHDDLIVDRSSEESFPASDAPSHTATKAIG